MCLSHFIIYKIKNVNKCIISSSVYTMCQALSVLGTFTCAVLYNSYNFGLREINLLKVTQLVREILTQVSLTSLPPTKNSVSAGFIPLNFWIFSKFWNFEIFIPLNSFRLLIHTYQWQQLSKGKEVKIMKNKEKLRNYHRSEMTTETWQLKWNVISWILDHKKDLRGENWWNPNKSWSAVVAISS